MNNKGMPFKKLSVLDWYREQGVNIIPLNSSCETNKPLLKEWKPYQERKATDAEIEGWKEQTGRFAIVCGEVSDNLVILDIDHEDLFAGLNLGVVAAKTYTEERARRFHIFLRTTQPIKSKSLKFNGKEDIGILSSGHLTTTGGTAHIKGGAYSHFITSPKEIATVEVGFFAHLEKLWRDYRGLTTKTKKGFGTLKAGITLNTPILEIVKSCTELEEIRDEEETLTCRCPFPDHTDSTPSFTIYKKTDSFFCFGCQRGGDVINFIRVFYGISTKKATERLKDEGRITVTDAEGEDVFRHKCFFEEEGTLYMQIFNAADGDYKFVYIKEGVIELTDMVSDTVPVEMPYTKEGEIAKIVQMPDDGITTCKLLTPPELLEKIKTHVKTYCDLTDEDLELSAYYILFSWFYRKVNTVGYLRFLADTGKGKSRMLSVIGDLCFYPLSAGGSGSFSGMMRQKERWHGTIIVDEADMGGGKRNKHIKYINLGMERYKFFILTEKNDPSKQEVFDPFGPKIFGMREHFEDVATEGRLLSISPHETTNDAIPILLNRGYNKSTAGLRNEIARFVLEHWNDVDGERLLEFRDIGLEPRLQQLAMPLSVIFQLWPDGTDMFKSYMIRRRKELKKERAQSWEGIVFNLIYAIATGEEILTDYQNHYNEDDQIQAVTPTMIAKTLGTSAKMATDTLRSIGFEVERPYIVLRNVKKNKDGTEKNKDGTKEDEEDTVKTVKKRVRAYVVPNDKTWHEITQRYLDFEEVGNRESLISFQEEMVEIPEMLKSKKYSTCVNTSGPSGPSVPKEEKVGEVGKVGTHGTHGTSKNTRGTKNFLEVKRISPIEEGICELCDKKRFLSYECAEGDQKYLVCGECAKEEIERIQKKESSEAEN